jgi:hypothetical protein
MPYVGQDFPDTTPSQQRIYTLDFVNGLAIFFNEVVTVGGAPTPGDTIFLTVNNPSLAKLSETVSYVVSSSDTLTSIAAALAAAINGDDILNDAQITATASGTSLTIASPGQNLTVVTSFVAPAVAGGTVTETIGVAAGAATGETLSSCVCSTAVWQGTPDATTRILGSPTISGSKVSVLAGTFLAGNRYRITFLAVSPQQPAIELFSHINCVLPQ